MDCGSAQTFTCNAPGVSLGWNIAGLSGINIVGPFLARNAAFGNPRIKTNDTGSSVQLDVSNLTITGFSTSDNGGIIQCVDRNNDNTEGMATISVGESQCVCWVCKDVFLSCGKPYIMYLPVSVQEEDDLYNDSFSCNEFNVRICNDYLYYYKLSL